jgi:hypothetical protein
MVSRKQLIASNAVRTAASGATKLADSCATSKSPKGSVAKTQDKIRIARKDFLGKAIQFGFEFSSDVAGWEQGGVAGDAISFSSTEELEFVGRGMNTEDIGSVEFRM